MSNTTKVERNGLLPSVLLDSNAMQFCMVSLLVAFLNDVCETPFAPMSHIKFPQIVHYLDTIFLVTCTLQMQ